MIEYKLYLNNFKYKERSGTTAMKHNIHNYHEISYTTAGVL